MTAEADTDLPVHLGELVRVRRRRYWEAIDAGLTTVEARLFADSDVDVGELRRLVDKGCGPELIARIVL